MTSLGQHEGRAPGGLGLPAQTLACLFDLDGVLTQTAKLHAAAWKQMFDEYLAGRADRTGAAFVPFRVPEDYAAYVDGKLRIDGARSFLDSRGLVLSEAEVEALADRKNALFVDLLHRGRVETYAGSVHYLRAVREAGLLTAVVSASKHTDEVLAATGLGGLVDVRIDGYVAAREGLAGKPSPDTYLAAARALGVAAEHAVVFEDAIAGVEAGRNGHFLYVVGVDRADDTTALVTHGADVVVKDLSALLGAEISSAEAMTKTPLSAEELHKLDAYWRAANYLSVGQIYLYDNPLLKQPLTKAHIKPRLLGHWGTTPGLNFIYAHLNRVIRRDDLDMIYIAGPGHGGPGLVANTYLEGTYSEIYPSVSQDEEGMKRLFTQFSFPGGIPSHVAPETPGSIHEGGELGYSLSHAHGAAFDNPELIVACVVGDGEAETGPLATSWHSNKFLNPATDGAVLPILHLNGYKIANPTVLARITHEELDQLLRGYGYTPYYVEGDDPQLMHQAMASVLDAVVTEIRRIWASARNGGGPARPRWPMIVLRSPKGWTGPREVDGKKTEGTWRSHQVPMGAMHENPEHVRLLEAWMKSYRPDELFDEAGRLRPELRALAPTGTRRMSANPHANGGLLLRDLELPDFRDYAVEVPQPGASNAEATRVMGKLLRDVMRENLGAKNFRIFSPDENNSNRWQDVLEVTDRAWDAERLPYDDHLAASGRVMEMLSEHQCQGWLEGYLLTGRHGFFSCYEAFIHIVDSMFNQHAKWLKVCQHIPWRRPIASLNYLLSSHVWRQDHNGFSHQDPGFIDHVVNKKASVIRVYLPPDANCLLSVTDHCLRSRDYVNVIVAGKQSAPQWLTMDQAIKHCTAGLGIWDWASSDQGGEPDVVMACCGDVPTLETLAAVQLLRGLVPELKVRVINIVDLMKLQPPEEHPHGLSHAEFDVLFTVDKPIIFAFHGYPWLIHRLTYRRTNHKNLHVRGYKEEGTTTTPFDMVVLNDLDRFHLVSDVIDRVPKLREKAAYAKQAMRDLLIEHKHYIARHGEDMPEILGWRWEGHRADHGQ